MNFSFTRSLSLISVHQLAGVRSSYHRHFKFWTFRRSPPLRSDAFRIPNACFICHINRAVPSYASTVLVLSVPSIRCVSVQARIPSGKSVPEPQRRLPNFPTKRIYTFRPSSAPERAARYNRVAAARRARRTSTPIASLTLESASLFRHV